MVIPVKNRPSTSRMDIGEGAQLVIHARLRRRAGLRQQSVPASG
jgi:hypothetical protein